MTIKCVFEFIAAGKCDLVKDMFLLLQLIKHDKVVDVAVTKLLSCCFTSASYVIPIPVTLAVGKV